MKTYRNNFQAPTARQFLTEIQTLKNQDINLSFQKGEQCITLHDLRFDGNIAKLLFRITDPRIPDNIVENQEDHSLRTLERNEEEVPAISAHLIVNIDARFDQALGYPATFENVEILSKSNISWFFNQLCEQRFSTQIAFDDTGKLKKYRPNVEIRGHQSQTIGGILNGGGKLHGLRLVTTKVEQDAFADLAYPVLEYSDIHMDIIGRPSGQDANSTLQNMWRHLTGRDQTNINSAKVVLEDLSGRIKTSQIDTRIQDIASNFFISQVHMTDFDIPLTMCEDVIRDDLVSKMISALPRE
ncbi:MAG: hypothetical protein COB39_03225 [Marinosulfonomonas sp.]|nr:MAG: hypothetical protein COB39_03225 [Marinosulfonomonas sp.]